MDPSLSLLPVDLRSVDHSSTHVKPEISADTITSLNCGKTLEPTGIVVKKESDDEEYSGQESKFAVQRCKEETEENGHQFNQYDDSLRQVNILETGKKKYSKEKPYQCEECGKIFAKAGVLKKHKTTHTGKKLYQCPQCVKSFTRSSYLQSHKRTHTGEKPYQCVHCGKSFAKTSHLKRHKRTHTGEKPYKCEECGRSFSDASYFKRHNRIHLANIYQCALCSKCFRSLAQLKHHQRFHTEEKANKRTEKKSDIITPVNLVETVEVTVKDEKQDLDGVIHSDQERKFAEQLRCQEKTEEKLHQFNNYNNSLRQVKVLETQQRNYSKEKPYQCEECGKRFTHASNLKRHKRTHTGERPYQCEQCGKRFSCASTLKRHKRTHTGEKPYQCVQCGKRYPFASTFNRHKRMHTVGNSNTFVQHGKRFTLASFKCNQSLHTDDKIYTCIAVVELKKLDITTPIHCGNILEPTRIVVKKELDEMYSVLLTILNVPKNSRLTSLSDTNGAVVT